MLNMNLASKSISRQRKWLFIVAVCDVATNREKKRLCRRGFVAIACQTLKSSGCCMQLSQIETNDTAVGTSAPKYLELNQTMVYIEFVLLIVADRAFNASPHKWRSIAFVIYTYLLFDGSYYKPLFIWFIKRNGVHKQ